MSGICAIDRPYIQSHKLYDICATDRQCEFNVISCLVSVPLIDSVSSVILVVIDSVSSVSLVVYNF